jgi:hypothetical protein
MTGLSSWYDSVDPILDIGLRDPDIAGHPGSGIDISSVQYRIMERSSDGFSEWIDHTGEVETITGGVEGDSRVSLGLELSLYPEWRGSIQFKASDIVGNSVESVILDMGVDVKAPTFELLSPSLLSTHKEGNIDLVIKAVDRPGSGVDPSTVEWRYGIDGVMSQWLEVNASGGGEEMVFDIRHYFYPGKNEIQFRAEDNVGNEGESEMFRLTVEKKIENLPPVPGIRSPLNGTVISIGTPLTLDGSDSYDDGFGPYGELRYTWISNIDGYLGSGEVVSIYLGSLGEHRIRLYVDDGAPGHNISTEVNVVVKEKDDPNGTEYDPPSTEERDYWMPILFGVVLMVIILAIVIVLVRHNRRKKDEEATIGYIERTEDDLEYERRLEEEEMSLGLTSDEDERFDEDMELERRELYGYE